MYERLSSRVLPVRQFAWRLLGHIGLVGVVVVGSLAIGMAGYRFLAPMSWLDAFVNASMLLGGMGPVAPLRNDPVKLFAGFYALYSGLVFVASLSVIMAPIIHRILHHLHAEDADGA